MPTSLLVWNMSRVLCKLGWGQYLTPQVPFSSALHSQLSICICGNLQQTCIHDYTCTNMLSVCEDTALESAHLCHSFAQFPGAQMASHWWNDTLNLQASPNLEPEPFPFQFPMRGSFCCGAQHVSLCMSPIL